MLEFLEPQPLLSLSPSASLWCCVVTKRYKEQWVAQQLAACCDEVYLPLLRQKRKIRRQLKWTIEPLFPGYLFARFAIEAKYCAVRYTPGVSSVLGTQDTGPIVVDSAVISTLQATSQEGYLEIQAASFCPGEELEILVGPFQQLRAVFQQELKAGERVAVLLDLLSSQVRVELPRDYVRKK
jgi:transcriptional antiterminator RfaH